LAPTTTPDPALLVEATAHGWRPVPDQDVVHGSQWDDVTWTGDRFVATDSIARTAIQSRDGIRWTEAKVPVSTLPVGIPKNAVDAAFGAAGWIAVGTEPYDGPCASWCPPLRGLAWTSPDAERWTSTAKQRSLASADLADVAAWQDGYVAAGSVDGRGAIWWSADGRTWTGQWLAPNKELLSSAVSLASLAGTLVAAGYGSDQDSTMRALAVWSTDGRHWSESAVERADDSQIFDVAAAGVELLAAGPSSGCGLWSSADGRAWMCLVEGSLAELTPNAVASSPTVEVVVGMDDAAGGGIWWRARPD
jgi:hypothetical protein